MSRTERARLADIAAAIAAIELHRKRPAAAEEPRTRDAVLHQLVVVGEAVKHLSPTTRAREPDIPWADIAGLRDLIAHEYFRIDDSRIQEIAERDLPKLREAISRLLVDA